MGISSGKIKELPVNLEKEIKSTYIFKIIFSYLQIKKKLSLIIYNKIFQKKLYIDIDHYKNIIGKTREIKNGKGREYNFKGRLIFKGEYLNKKRNGKGEEYYENGNLKFEGEYFEGKRLNGKGYNIYVFY